MMSAQVLKAVAVAAPAIMIGAMAIPGSAPGQSQATCASRDQIRKTLETVHNETARGIGLISPTRIIEIYTSDEGTFSVAITTSDGKSCVIAVGEAWEYAAETTAEVSS